jgi:type IV pilus assembly protein PilV
MLEVLVTILILLLGLLGLAGLQMRAHTAEMESYQRAQALIIASKMVDTIRLNRRTASCFAITNAGGTPFVGADGAGHAGGPIVCNQSTIAENAMAVAAMDEWDRFLVGAAELKDGTEVGAMIGARGCVSYDPTTELIDPETGAVVPESGLYTVVVAWQGLNETIAPAVNCANGLYGTETRRRAVSMSLRLARLQ